MVTQETKIARNRGALDWINFLLADVQDGLGPFLAIYLLSSQHWDPARIGVVMSVSGIATVVARTPVGSLVDRIAWKRELVAGAAAVVGFGAALTALFPGFWVVAVGQGVIGAANAVFPPAIAAITLGVAGRRAFTGQIGRNEGFNHAGNAATAITAGALGYYVAQSSVLWVVVGLAAASMVAALRVRADDIDHDVARGGLAVPKEGAAKGPEGVRALLADRRLLVFAAAITLFHFANAAMLPILGEKLAGDNPRFSSLFIAACIITAQVVMVPTTLLAGRLADRVGRKPLFLVGFAALPIRGLLYTVTNDPYVSVAIQVLDGVGAGIFSVLFLVVVEDLTRGTGRYNLAQGMTSAAWGFGAALSNTVAGFIVQAAGFDAAFLFLAGVAVAAFLLFLFAVPETRPEAEAGADATPAAQPA